MCKNKTDSVWHRDGTKQQMMHQVLAGELVEFKFNFSWWCSRMVALHGVEVAGLCGFLWMGFLFLVCLKLWL